MSSKSLKSAVTVFETLESRTMMSGTPLGVAEGAFMGGTQLRITGTAGDDQITVRLSADGRGLEVGNTGGWLASFIGTYKNIWADALAGNDSVVIDASVSAAATLFGGLGNDSLTGGAGDDRLYGGAGVNALDGAAGDDVLVSLGGMTADRCTGGTGRDSFWADAASTEVVADLSPEESATGSLHRVASFYTSTGGSSLKRGKAAAGAAGAPSVAGKAAKAGKVKKAAKAPKASPLPVGVGDLNLSDPAVTDARFTYKNFSDRPLFAEAGPLADDIDQGNVGDCYYLATLSSVAAVDPTRIRESVVDLGDGTYAVQFSRGTGKVFVRVDGDLPASADGLPAYAGLGGQDALWVAVMEKAFAHFRTGAGTYASIDSGWMTEAYSALGVTSQSTYTASSGVSSLGLIRKELLAGKSVTYAADTPAAGAPLIASHAYSAVSVGLDANGNPFTLRLRNPWATDGAGRDGANDGYVTLTAQQALASLLGFASAAV